MLIVKEKTQTYLQSKSGCGCVICPNCSAHEVEVCDDLDSKWWISAHKVDDWSKCYKCRHWFNDYGETTPMDD